MTMQWRRIDGVNKPALERVSPHVLGNKYPLMVSDELGKQINLGRFLAEGQSDGEFLCQSIPQDQLKWFLEIEPPVTGEAE